MAPVVEPKHEIARLYVSVIETCVPVSLGTAEGETQEGSVSCTFSRPLFVSLGLMRNRRSRWSPVIVPCGREGTFAKAVPAEERYV